MRFTVGDLVLKVGGFDMVAEDGGVGMGAS